MWRGFIFGGIFLMVLMSFLVTAQVGRNVNLPVRDFVLDDFEIGNLEQNEIEGLFLMREEEKLARDVYLALYEKHSLPIFNNIAASEQTHMDAVLVLIERYNLEDSASGEGGIFNDAKLQELYTSLVQKGESSLMEALIIGATIEDLDIFDLNKLISETDKADLIMVYSNLIKGSRNHLRSFVEQLENQGGSYSAQYIEESLLNEILSTGRETGPLLDENDHVVSSFNSRLRMNQAVGRRMVQSGIYRGSLGEQMRINWQNDVCKLEVDGVVANCPFNLSQEQIQNRTRLSMDLSNGRNTEIKVMPDVASQTALQRLRLRDCNGECNIELKEVGRGDNMRAVYEVKTQRTSRFLGLFKMGMDVEAQVDAETGEVIRTKKPWWAFLASEPAE